MVSSMKTNDDAPLNRYLVKHLQPLTEADPNLLANYVVALLKNNKPKKELQKLCIEQLYDFLGEETKGFVVKLFLALEDGAIQASQDAIEAIKVNDATTVPAGCDVAETRNSPHQSERAPTRNVQDSTNQEEEGTDDEDDDRNHKHRRRATRSRSFERDGDEEDERGSYRKRSKQTDTGQSLRDSDRPVSETCRGSNVHLEREAASKNERRTGRDHGYGGASTKLNPEVNQRAGMRGVVAFRSDALGSRFDSQNGLIRGPLGRGKGGGGGGSWSSHEQRYSPFDGPDFSQSILPPGPPSSIFPGRAIPGRGNPPHSPWGPYGHLSGIGNGSLDQALSLNPGMQGGRAVPISASIGVGMNMVMGMTIGRPRCPDFEERGYCLRGDLCPMEHGANRIVVEDVQSLSQFNLPVTLPSGRGMGMGPGPVAVPSSVLPPSGLGLNSRALRETLDEPAISNGALPSKMTSEPDLYDPDQPLWNHPEAGGGMRRLPSLRRGQDEHDWETSASDRRGRPIPEDGEAEKHARVAAVGLQSGQSGSSVWDRIGPVDRGEVRVDGVTRSLSNSGEVPHRAKFPRKDTPEDQQTQCKAGTGFGKLEGELDLEKENAAKTTNVNVLHGKSRVAMRGEAGPNAGEGTSYGSRAGGVRGSSGLGPERAQRTLYVSCIPVSNNKRENLLAHFQKFGEILDVRIPAHSDRAFVQFSRREDADAALQSPEAVMGNRFIRLSWANWDSIPKSGESNAAVNGHTINSVSEIGTQVLRGKEKVGGGSIAVEANVTENMGKLPGPNNQSSLSVAMSQKKQEELEQMKEELRRKQEKLAQKRNDFRRKLDQLSRQGVGVKGDLGTSQLQRKSEESDTAGLCKLVSSDAVAVASEAGQSSSDHSTHGTQRPVTGDTSKQASGTGQIFPSSIPQPSPRGLRSPFPRPGGAVWSPVRYKLDNRTTIFRILPPFPDCPLDVAALKEHYASFGELISVELEDSEGQKSEGSKKLTDKSVVRVTFGTRRAAERAFIQGRWFHGMSLQLAWFAPTNSMGVVSSAGSKQADGTKENVLVHSLKPPTSTSSFSENTLMEEKKHGGVEDVIIGNNLPAGENLVEREGVQLMHGMTVCSIEAGQVQRCANNTSSDVSVKLDGDSLGIHTESSSVKPVS